MVAYNRLWTIKYPVSVWRGLMRRGLVQGKNGSGWRVVHTREGLNYVRGQQ